MSKEVITISSAVLVGALSRGATGLITVSNPVKMGINGLLTVGAGYLATRVSGTDGKSAFLRGSAFGIAVAQAGELVKSIFSTPTVSAKLSSETSFGRFAQKAVGLSGAVNGLNGYVDENGNYHEDGLGGYIDINGNYVDYGLSGAETLNAYDEYGNPVDGLSAYDEYGNPVDGLSAYDEYGNPVDGLSAYVDENGNYMI